MIAAALKALTWGTLVTAVVSAFLLASAGGNMPRITALVSDVMRAGPASSAQPGGVEVTGGHHTDANRAAAAH
jgi:hypothetical protein